jgi:hypothetical protein
VAPRFGAGRSANNSDGRKVGEYEVGRGRLGQKVRLTIPKPFGSPLVLLKLEDDGVIECTYPGLSGYLRTVVLMVWFEVVRVL